MLRGPVVKEVRRYLIGDGPRETELLLLLQYAAVDVEVDVYPALKSHSLDDLSSGHKRLLPWALSWG